MSIWSPKEVDQALELFEIKEVKQIAYPHQPEQFHCLGRVRTKLVFMRILRFVVFLKKLIEQFPGIVCGQFFKREC